eukprot:TRINITY_DN60836_c0_g1_i1.p1 TRINITY_DN60836_c0_g1~~TRINITY_DN60836_c0_g1_i1.p1  ORF type:complete len:1005 (+),score=129.52 TRINITY_DN60836_c0_g1_i1:101-3016(+)
MAGCRLWDLSARLRRPRLLELHAEAVLLQKRVARAALIQLKSPRARLRSAALRTLCAVAQAMRKRTVSTQDIVPRSVILSTLTRDESAHVRHAAIALLEILLGVTSSSEPRGSEAVSSCQESIAWAVSVARKVANSDPSQAVRVAAQRLLGMFVRHHPNDSSVNSVCRDLVSQLAGPHVSGFRSTVIDDLRSYIFPRGADVRAKEFLQLLAVAHRFGVKGLLMSLIRSRRSVAISPGDEDMCFRDSVRNVVAALVGSFTSDPAPAHVAGLLAVSNAVPWALVDHARTIATYLAIEAVPSASGEVVALGACTVLAEVLGSIGHGVGQVLTPWACARLDLLVTSHSSRLARPAMRCLCVAAQAESSSRLIVRHLRQSAAILRAEIAEPGASKGLTRAAWVVATACEYCDLDRIVSVDVLELPRTMCVDMPVGKFFALEILQILGLTLSDVALSRTSAAPTLIMALGFVLRRHTWLLGEQAAVEALTCGLDLKLGQELLTERSLEAFAQLLDSLTDQAEKQGSKSSTTHAAAAEGQGNIMAGGSSAGLAACEAAAQLARYQPAVLNLIQHGLRRRAEAADVPVRTRALAAARALHRAGLGRSAAMAHALFAPLFSDRVLRRGVATLLWNVASKDSDAVASVLISGIREAFCAMLWQAPHQMSLVRGSLGVGKAVIEASRSFAASRRVARMRWVKNLLTELHDLHGDGFLKRLPSVLVSVSRASRAGPGFGSSGRLAPFGGGRRGQAAAASGNGSVEEDNGGKSQAAAGKANVLGGAQTPVEPCAAEVWAQTSWPPQRRLLLLYGQFVSSLIASLPLVEAEVSILSECCSKFLELRAAATVSAEEFSSDSTTSSSSDGVFAVCVSSALSRAILRSVSAPAGLSRLDAMRAALLAQLPSLSDAAQHGSSELAEWLQRVLENGIAETKFDSLPPQRRRNQRGSNGSGVDAATQLTPIKKRRPQEQLGERPGKNRRTV